MTSTEVLKQRMELQRERYKTRLHAIPPNVSVNVPEISDCLASAIALAATQSHYIGDLECQLASLRAEVGMLRRRADARLNDAPPSAAQFELRLKHGSED